MAVSKKSEMDSGASIEEILPFEHVHFWWRKADMLSVARDADSEDLAKSGLLLTSSFGGDLLA
jgi:hypothetical protein